MKSANRRQEIRLQIANCDQDGCVSMRSRTSRNRKAVEADWVSSKWNFAVTIIVLCLAIRTRLCAHWGFEMNTVQSRPVAPDLLSFETETSATCRLFPAWSCPSTSFMRCLGALCFEEDGNSSGYDSSGMQPFKPQYVDVEMFLK